MSLRGLDTTSVARRLSQLVERDGDVVDAFFERLELAEVPSARDSAGVSLRREEGFAVRLSRPGRAWFASFDTLRSEDFQAALRQVARSRPEAAYPPAALEVEPWPEARIGHELERFAAALNRALRRRLVAFPLRSTVRRHRRWTQVIGTQLAPDPQSETFFSLEIETGWGRRGLLETDLGEQTIEAVADGLVALFEAREAAPPPAGAAVVTLAPAAAAILLHETVAHALEADTLARGGRIESALALPLASPELSVLDDPGSAPAPIRRSSDDEGQPVVRRWLLRGGVVEQPLADVTWARRSEALIPGAGRRGLRTDPPVPRSTHLVVPPGTAGRDDLAAGEGLWVPWISRGALDADTGLCRLAVPFAYRFAAGELGEAVGPFRIRGRVADLLGAVEAVGDDPVASGAGWCAKGGHRVPVWATTPALRLSTAEVVP